MNNVLYDKHLFEKIDESKLLNFYDSLDFPYLKHIEDNYQTIYNEWQRVTTSNNVYVANPQTNLYNKDWDAILLTEAKVNTHKNTYGEANYKELFPETVSIIEAALGSRLDMMLFSKIGSNTKIAPHRGRFSNTLRCHLGIDIPAGDCKIKVNNETRGWEAGKLLVLDDRLMHEVWNLTDKDRVVLLFDFVPDQIENFYPY
jgi:aspartyl/asparaginyl beta-hydroxylase (cupin superfamily)